jgi:hypothetical protein
MYMCTHTKTHKLPSLLQTIFQPTNDLATPSMKTSLLSKKWREERNFWIAAVAFLSWLVNVREREGRREESR